MRRRLAVLLWVMIAGACGPDPGVPGEPLATIGSIVARNITTPTSGNRPTLHIKTDSTDMCGVIYAVSSATVLRRWTIGGTYRANLVEFTVGSKVRVWSGPIAESCPGQATAYTLELLP